MRKLENQNDTSSSICADVVLINYRYGIGELIITVEGDGEVWIDQASLFPTDCVEEIYNPEAIANVKKQSGGQQLPWTNSSIEGEFYFVK